MNLRTFYYVLEEFRKLDSDIGARTIEAFLLVAEKPGINMKEIEQALGLSSSAASRHINALAQTHWRREKDGHFGPGHDLVVPVTDPDNRRAKLVMLTARGRKLVEKITFILGGITSAKA